MVNPESRVYNAYKLAEAIQDQDEAAIEYYGTEILIDTAVDAAPLGAVFTKLGMTKVGGIIMGLGAKVGDDVRSAVTKLGQKYGDNVWTSAGKTGVDNAIRHWNDHAADFPELSSLDEYVDYAHNFLKSPSKETLTKIRHNGDIMRYEPSSNTFGVMNADGIPKTIFKPKNGYEYWLRQK